MLKQLKTIPLKTILYFAGFALILGSSFVFMNVQRHSSLSRRSDLFYQVLSNDKQYNDVLIKDKDIYSEMTKLYLSLKNDPEFSHLFSHYFHTYFHRLMCIFPHFFLAQSLSIKLLQGEGKVDDLEVSYLVKPNSPWLPMVRWVKLAKNEENDNGKYTNFVCKKSGKDIDSLIKAEYRCTHDVKNT